VLLEAERNIRSKLNLQALNAYHDLLQVVPFTLAPVPRIPAESAWLEVINAKDTHVVASALVVKAPYVTTLDRGLTGQSCRCRPSTLASLSAPFCLTMSNTPLCVPDDAMRYVSLPGAATKPKPIALNRMIW
jgi:hypothetical protein